MIVGVWFSFAIFSSYVAGQKGRSYAAWFFLGLVFGIVALIAAAGVPSVEKSNGEVGGVGKPEAVSGDPLYINIMALIAVVVTVGIFLYQYWM